jgi:hypothetical protein
MNKLTHYCVYSYSTTINSNTILHMCHCLLIHFLPLEFPSKIVDNEVVTPRSLVNGYAGTFRRNLLLPFSMLKIDFLLEDGSIIVKDTCIYQTLDSKTSHHRRLSVFFTMKISRNNLRFFYNCINSIRKIRRQTDTENYITILLYNSEW